MVVSDLSGRRFGEYTATEKIGEGGSAVVYCCELGPLDRPVVVKVLLQRWSNEAQQRFLQEARLASRLRHTYAATVFTAGIDSDGFAWIAMELIEGVTLDAWLRANGPMTPDQFASFFAKVAEVVDEAHRVGIVHRDLTPSNVMVIQGRDGLEPRLLDFGIAMIAHESEPEPLAWPEGTLGENVQADAEADVAPLLVLPVPGRSRLTLPGERMGSAAYMSPEQWSNVRTVGPATDIYSLGVIAYEALSGRVPFERNPTAECRRQHQERTVPPLGGDFGADVDLVIKRAMAKTPGERHGTASELAADLRRALRSEREELRAAAQYWASRGHASGLLWSSDMLDVLQNWEHRSYVLSPLEKKFVAASLRALHKRRVMRRAIGVLVAALACGTPAYLIEARAQHDHDVADARIEAKTTEEERQEGRTELLYGGPDALAHLTRAQEGGDDSPSTAFMRARAAEPTLAVLARLAGANQRVSAARLSPNGRHLVTVGPDGAHVWNPESYQPLFTLPHPARLVSATFIADGSQLVTAGGDSVRVWSMNDGVLVRELARPPVQPSSSYLSVVASPDGKLIAAAHMDGSVVHVWDAATGALIQALASDGDGHPLLAFSHDGRWLAAAEPKGVHVYDTNSWKPMIVPGLDPFSWIPNYAAISCCMNWCSRSMGLR